MKIHIAFVEQTKLFDALNIRYVPPSSSFDVDGRRFIVFAYSESSKLMRQYRNDHIDNLFIYTTKSLTDDEFVNFQKANRQYELSDYSYTDGVKTITLVSTAYEYHEARYGLLEILQEYAESAFSHMVPEILEIFKPKYREALETLGLNACISVLSDEFESYLETTDEAVINIPCTRESPNPGSKIVTNVRMRPKTLNVYIHRFRGILRG